MLLTLIVIAAALVLLGSGYGLWRGSVQRRQEPGRHRPHVRMAHYQRDPA